MGRDAPSISHLLFADDLLLFAKATLREATKLDECLAKYMAWLGKKLKRDKSSVHFSKNFQGQAILSILDQLRLKKLPPKAKHLRLPLLFPRAWMRAVEDIKEKFFSKISGWKVKMLSQAGRMVMIKAVATALPSYLMSFYLLPQSWCKEIDRALKNFWWGYSDEKARYLSLKVWSSIC